MRSFYTDISHRNTLIDSDDHLVLIDFGTSIYSNGADDDDKNWNWRKIAFNCMYDFPKANRTEIQADLIQMLRNMNDAQIQGK